jgi:hypothetical protein
METNEISQAEAEVHARKSELARSLRRASDSGEQMVHKLGSELKPALVAGLAVAALSTVAGITLLITRRRRQSRWLPPQPPSVLGTAARGAALFLLRLAARQVASKVIAGLDATRPVAASGAARARVEP